MVRIWTPAAATCVAGNVGIVTAQPRHLSMIEQWQKKWHENLGFVPRSAMADRLDRGDYLRIDVNGQDAGFVLLGAGVRKPVRIFQILVCEDLWRRGVGRVTIESILRHAAGLPQPKVVGGGADGLPIHEVAAATGATCVHVTQPQGKRNRAIRYWEWTDLPQPNLPSQTTT